MSKTLKAQHAEALKTNKNFAVLLLDAVDKREALQNDLLRARSDAPQAIGMLQGQITELNWLLNWMDTTAKEEEEPPLEPDPDEGLRNRARGKIPTRSR